MVRQPAGLVPEVGITERKKTAEISQFLTLS
jgi:hypothetical protein